MPNNTLDRRFCVAPMLDWSDRHCRFFWRKMSRRAVLYTEMVTTGALLHGDQHRHLQFSTEEQPLALQLGGSDPSDLAKAVKLAKQWGYDEVNLNCGCPSDRVQNGFFGACLMARPSLVADCVAAMIDASDLPVTVKHRIGIDDQEGYEPLHDFVDQIHQAGCNTIIVHARKAWLQGLSPKENREIPPLNYDMVYQHKNDFPKLEVIIKGGIDSIDDALSHLSHVDGSMLGRSIYQNPYQLVEVDERIYADEANQRSRQDVVESLYPYIEKELASGTRLHHITRHILGIFNGQAGARQFRRHLSQHAHRNDAGLEVLQEALALTTTAQQRLQDYAQQRAAQTLQESEIKIR